MNRVEQFIKRELSYLKDISILNPGEEHYILFGRYEVKFTGKFYTVELFDVYLTEDFNFLQCAITWCVYHHNKKHAHLKRIQQLDNRLTSLDLSIKMHNRMLNQIKDFNDACIIETKLEDEIVRKNQLQKELDVLIAASRAWQQNKFKDKIT